MDKSIKNKALRLSIRHEKRVVDIISLANSDDFFNDLDDDDNFSFEFTKEDLEFFRLEGLE